MHQFAHRGGEADAAGLGLPLEALRLVRVAAGGDAEAESKACAGLGVVLRHRALRGERAAHRLDRAVERRDQRAAGAAQHGAVVRGDALAQRLHRGVEKPARFAFAGFAAFVEAGRIGREDGGKPPLGFSAAQVAFR
jgi:hypothetical protein